jgi:hypothetical protein
VLFVIVVVPAAVTLCVWLASAAVEPLIVGALTVTPVVLFVMVTVPAAVTA